MGLACGWSAGVWVLWKAALMREFVFPEKNEPTVYAFQQLIHQWRTEILQDVRPYSTEYLVCQAMSDLGWDPSVWERAFNTRLVR